MIASYSRSTLNSTAVQPHHDVVDVLVAAARQVDEDGGVGGQLGVAVQVKFEKQKNENRRSLTSNGFCCESQVYIPKNTQIGHGSGTFWTAISLRVTGTSRVDKLGAFKLWDI